jgi:hypothetical protein
MEGSSEFLDAEGEWHFDQASRTLYVVPPGSTAAAAAGGGTKEQEHPSMSLVLTQTDALFRFEASAKYWRILAFGRFPLLYPAGTKTTKTRPDRGIAPLRGDSLRYAIVASECGISKNSGKLTSFG